MARYLSRESEPYGKWKGIPIYLTTILCAALVIGLIVTAFLGSARSPLVRDFIFAFPMSHWTGWLSVITYPFIDNINFFTPFGIMVFYWLAVGIETHLGRSALVKLLVIITLVPVAVSAVAWWGFSMPTYFPTFSLVGLSGTSLILGALLIAFATLYPNAEFWGWVPFKWVAFACFVCGSLMAVAQRDVMSVSALWLSCLAAFLFIRHAVEQEYDDHVPLTVRIRSWFRRKPKFRVVPRARKTEASHIREESGDDDELDGEVDDLLEKIARNGIASLTARERARLEEARENLLKKERK
jgi:hypothetical protein